jgi:hypothetical protein
MSLIADRVRIGLARIVVRVRTEVWAAIQWSYVFANSWTNISRKGAQKVTMPSQMFLWFYMA